MKRNMGRNEHRIECGTCRENVVVKFNGHCPACNAQINIPKTIDKLPQTVSVFCRGCHAWVSASKVKPLTNWFSHGRLYAAGLYQIQVHKGTGLLKLKCSSSGRVYKQRIRLDHKIDLS